MSIETDENRRSVVELATEAKAETIVEIGVRRGRLSILLFKVPTLKHLYLIDIWLPEAVTHQNQYKNARSVKRWANKRGGDKVTVLHMPSAVAAKVFKDNSLDFVYIDGDHSVKGVTADIKNYLPKIRKGGGVISGDDYDIPSVREAVDRLIPNRQLHSSTRIWYAKL